MRLEGYRRRGLLGWCRSRRRGALEGSRHGPRQLEGQGRLAARCRQNAIFVGRGHRWWRGTFAGEGQSVSAPEVEDRRSRVGRDIASVRGQHAPRGRSLDWHAPRSSGAGLDGAPQAIFSHVRRHRLDNHYLGEVRRGDRRLVVRLRFERRLRSRARRPGERPQLGGIDRHASGHLRGGGELLGALAELRVRGQGALPRAAQTRHVREPETRSLQDVEGTGGGGPRLQEAEPGAEIAVERRHLAMEPVFGLGALGSIGREQPSFGRSVRHETLLPGHVRGAIGRLVNPLLTEHVRARKPLGERDSDARVLLHRERLRRISGPDTPSRRHGPCCLRGHGPCGLRGHGPCVSWTGRARCVGLESGTLRRHAQPTKTVPSATTEPTGASDGSLHVMAGSPIRAAGLFAKNTVVLPS